MSWTRTWAPESPAALDGSARAGGATAASCCNRGFAAKIGAGCGPFCRNSALSAIANTANVAMTTPTNSRGWLPIAVASLPAPSNAISLRVVRLRTFLHLIYYGPSKGPVALYDELDGFVCGARAFAVDG